MPLLDLRGIIISLPVILLSLSFHEFAHAWMADRMGDPTARLSGRLTMDPLAHIDPLGFILLIFAHWGWAKPVPFNPYNFRRPKQGILYTSLAGPVSNVILAVIAGVILKLLGLLNVGNEFVGTMVYQLFLINLGLAAFNLIPLPPLDGSKILAGLLPDRGSSIIWSLEAYGPFILAALIFFHGIDLILDPLVSVVGNLVIFVVNSLFFFWPRG